MLLLLLLKKWGTSLFSPLRPIQIKPNLVGMTNLNALKKFRKTDNNRHYWWELNWWGIELVEIELVGN